MAPRPPWNSGAQATLVASIDLMEDDSMWVSYASALAIDSESGDFFISDRRFPRVVRFNRAGNPLRIYAAPRERLILYDAADIAISDGTLYVADLVNKRLVGFDLASGEAHSSFDLPGLVGPSFAQPAPDLWMGTHYRGATKAQPHGARVWRVRDDFGLDLPLPEEFFEYPAIKVHAGLNVIDRGDHLVVGYTALETLLRIPLPAGVPDTLRVPSPGRRGVWKEALSTYRMDLRGVSTHASRLVLLDEDREGNVVLVHFDQEQLPAGNLGTVVLVSVLTPDLRLACPDGRVPVESDRIPNLRFASDTLWFQTAKVQGETQQHHVLAYEISTAGCEWQPVQRWSSFILP